MKRFETEDDDELNYFVREFNLPVYFSQTHNAPFRDKLGVIDSGGARQMNGVEIKRNRFGYRSDEFTTNHDGQHILFTGCSQTFGVGLELEEMWSYKLHKKISAHTKTSGYFNLSWPGTSLKNITLLITQYIEEFGKPDIIFLNMPDIARHYAYDPSQDIIRSAMVANDRAKINKDSGIFKEFEMSFFVDLLVLQKLCKLGGINLISTTWVSQNNELSPVHFMREHYMFDSFVSYSQKDLISHCAGYMSQFPEDEYAIIARDNGHEGTAVNDFWTNMLYEEYLKVSGL